MSLQGTNVVVTGASMGLGARIAEELVGRGASVLICARGLEALEETTARLRGAAAPGQVVAATACDVTDEAAVDALFQTALSLFPRIDALVNNAGVYGPFGAIEAVDWAAWKDAITINLYGAVYPSRLFVPHFKAQGRGKIVFISGGGATNPLPNISAYAASKAAVVRFAESLAGEVKAFGIDVNAVAPGVLQTRLTDQLLEAGRDAVGDAFVDRITALAGDGARSIGLAGELVAYLCSRESDGVTGRLISALWDPWSSLHERRAALDRSDIYTLRRIVPKDRGENWGE